MTERLADADLEAIERRLSLFGVSQLASVDWYKEDVPALVAEVRRLQKVEDAAKRLFRVCPPPYQPLPNPVSEAYCELADAVQPQRRCACQAPEGSTPSPALARPPR